MRSRWTSAGYLPTVKLRHQKTNLAAGNLKHYRLFFVSELRERHVARCLSELPTIYSTGTKQRLDCMVTWGKTAPGDNTTPRLICQTSEHKLTLNSGT